jgi:hypothetical protein
MPVCSEVIAMAFFTAQFCIGGMYNRAASKKGISRIVVMVIPVHLIKRLIMLKV